MLIPVLQPYKCWNFNYVPPHLDSLIFFFKSHAHAYLLNYYLIPSERNSLKYLIDSKSLLLSLRSFYAEEWKQGFYMQAES